MSEKKATDTYGMPDGLPFTTEGHRLRWMSPDSSIRDNGRLEVTDAEGRAVFAVSFADVYEFDLRTLLALMLRNATDTEAVLKSRELADTTPA